MVYCLLGARGSSSLLIDNVLLYSYFTRCVYLYLHRMLHGLAGSSGEPFGSRVHCENLRLACTLEEVLPVGKHKGKTFEKVMTEDPTYCAWVMDLCKEATPNSTALLRFKEFLEDKGFSSHSEGIVTTGKHTGKTLEEVMTEDPSYCGWVMSLSTEGIDTISMLRLRKLLEANGFQAPASARDETSRRALSNPKYSSGSRDFPLRLLKSLGHSATRQAHSASTLWPEAITHMHVRFRTNFPKYCVSVTREKYFANEAS